MIRHAVLVIDDDKSWRNLMARLLAGSEYDVYSAATCAAGIAMAEKRRPDCIVLDFHLSDGSAWDVCRRVRAHREIKNTPILILSSDPDAETSACGECRADKFILKNEPLSDIRTGIENLFKARAPGAEQS